MLCRHGPDIVSDKCKQLAKTKTEHFPIVIFIWYTSEKIELSPTEGKKANIVSFPLFEPPNHENTPVHENNNGSVRKFSERSK